MKKQIKRTGIVALSALMMVSGFASCGKDGFKDDPNTLYVGVYDSGVDAAWMDTVAAMYMAEHPDKTVVVVKKKIDYEAQNLQNTIEVDIEDMYFTHIMPIRTWAEEGYILDITDVMQSKASESEDKTIEQKCIQPDILEYFRDDEGHYYGMPFYSSLAGVIYDVDLFEQKGLYLKKGGGYTAWDPINEEIIGEKTLGRDGLPNTSDDGLPVTYEEFKSLCDYMATQKSVVPFTWAPNSSYTHNGFLQALMANYEGANDFRLNFTMDGTDSQFGKISIENGDELLGQRGKEYAATFAHDIISKKSVWFKEDIFNTSVDQFAAQENFLFSAGEGEPVAMLLEGAWWENEAHKTGIFDDVVDTFNNDAYAHGTRRFAMMSIPLFDENHSQTNTLFNALAGTSVIINAKTSKPDFAKDFLRFASTKEAMRIFNVSTGQVRPYEYDLEPEEYNQLSPFSQSLYQLIKVEDNAITNNLATNVYVSDLESDYFYQWFWKCKIGTSSYSDMIKAFYNNSSLTAAQYIQGGKTYYSDWDRQLGDYFD